MNYAATKLHSMQYEVSGTYWPSNDGTTRPVSSGRFGRERMSLELWQASVSQSYPLRLGRWVVLKLCRQRVTGAWTSERENSSRRGLVRKTPQISVRPLLHLAADLQLTCLRPLHHQTRSPSTYLGYLIPLPSWFRMRTPFAYLTIDLSSQPTRGFLSRPSFPPHS